MFTKYHISNLLHMALSQYRDWKHPYKLFDTPKYRQDAKDRFHKTISFYREMRKKYCS